MATFVSTLTNSSGKFALANSIDASGPTYTANPITNFSGTLEGLGNTINNLTIQNSTNTDSRVGLFGSFEFGRMENFGLVNANVSGLIAGQSVGSVIGLMYSGGTTLYNVHATGSVSSLSAAGGLVALAPNGTISSSYANVAVTSTDSSGASSVGGLVGSNAATITGSHSMGTVTATNGSGVGGLVGTNTGAISNSYASAVVTGFSYVGGLVGNNQNANISYSYATGNVTGIAQAGGLIGVNTSSFTDTTHTSYLTGVDHSYATGTVTSGSTSFSTTAGGLIGDNETSYVTNSYATGKVVGQTTASSSSAKVNSLTSTLGGLIGYNYDGRVANSYATGSVLGSTGTITHPANTSPASTATDILYESGGLIGNNASSSDGNGVITDSPVTQSYASGAVRGGIAGGLIGVNSGASIKYGYALGAVTGGTAGYAGGLIGLNSGRVDTYFVPIPPNGGLTTGAPAPAAVSQVYAIGAVSGGGANGGLIGRNQTTSQWGKTATATLSQAYWDQATTGQSAVIGANAGTLDPSVFAVGAPDPFSQSSYQQSLTPGANFDFGTQWYSIDGLTRPFLRSEVSAVIVNTHQLELVGSSLSGSYTLGADINASTELLASGMWRTSSNASLAGAYGFVTVGDNSNHYSGTFDGQSHTISNLTSARPNSTFVGLFGFIDALGSVQNLNLTNVTVTGQDSVGGLAGDNHGTIKNVTVLGTVTGSGNNGSTMGSTGMVVGNNDGLILNSSSDGTVSGKGSFSRIGGLVGTNGIASSAVVAAGMIKNSFSSASVSSIPGDNSAVGGLVGFNQGSVTGSHATGDVSNGGASGGLAGINDGSGSIVDSYATGLVGSSGFLSSAGGLVGNNYGSVSGSYATGNVTGDDASSAGGLVGYNEPGSSSITNSYATGSVTVNSPSGGNVGGLVGNNSGSVSTSYATGAITDIGNFGPWAGGLVGYQSGGSIDKSYATGSVTVSGTGGSAGPTSGNQPAAGGLVGYNDGTSTITKSYVSGAVSVTGQNAEGGGLAGYNNGTITDAYARGSVTGSNGSIIGGFVGYNDSTGSIARTYAANVVAGATGQTPASSGGFVGINVGGASITNSFWDTSMTTMAGSGSGAGTFSATGLATSLMQDSISSSGFYARASGQGWDFHTVWAVPNFDTAQSSDGQRHYAELYALSRVVSAIANNATKTYGDPNPAQSANTYGLQNSDVLATPVTVQATTITPASNVGTYAGAISVSGGSAIDQTTNNNYRLVYLPGTFTITPRPITITGGTVDRSYGAPNPATTNQFTTALTTGSGSGLVNGDTIGSVTVISATSAATGVGNYAFTPGAANFAAGSATNYAITYADGALTVHPAALTIIADTQTRAFNAANPLLTYQVSGTLFNGDMITGTLATTANTGSPDGNYPITQGTLTASSNYNLTYVGALLTVLPGGLPGGTPSASPSIIDASLLASSILRDSFYPIALPDDASPIFDAPTIVTTLGTGIFYVDPRFDQIFVCFGGGGGTARACFAAKE